MVSGAFGKPSAAVPVLMSLAALLLVGVHVATFGTGREADEGVAAHLFQLLIALQLPIVLYHAVRWLPRSPRQGIQVFGLQVLAVALACLPVAVLGL
ncbi:hypothetical protein [Roseateles saccharophilus]|uniref:Uncharacterized protein n=1 Tax=Roseateles saccharophilus TaxID=304 RepID=A0A4R3UB32_ROSSA|nr:hypothetical protein [Roseateles saccharophilus]MDG0835719.1 hypothetical protein [Roseateles saccharophilus]TCU84051.1 hypothetical protein EV671_10558 [Roseateles saccharophilus]